MSPEVNLKKIDTGTLVPIRVVPRASRTEVDGIQDGAIRIRLKAPPVDGAANKALCAFLAKMVRVPKSGVEIAAGQRGRSKTVLIKDVEPSLVLRCLLPTGSVQQASSLPDHSR